MEMRIWPRGGHPGGNAPGAIPRNTEDRLYHTVVEGIDPRRGELLARHEIPFLGVRVAPGCVGHVRISDSGSQGLIPLTRSASSWQLAMSPSKPIAPASRSPASVILL